MNLFQSATLALGIILPFSSAMASIDHLSSSDTTNQNHPYFWVNRDKLNTPKSAESHEDNRKILEIGEEHGSEFDIHNSSFENKFGNRWPISHTTSNDLSPNEAHESDQRGHQISVTEHNDGPHAFLDKEKLDRDHEDKCSPVPLPAAIWLFATGLAGLLLQKRSD